MWFGLDEKVGHQRRPGLANACPGLRLGGEHLPARFRPRSWRRQCRPGGLRICPVCVPGGAAGRGRPERGGTLTHTRDPPSEQIQGAGRSAVVAGRMKRVPSSVSDGISDEPGARVSGRTAVSASVGPALAARPQAKGGAESSACGRVPSGGGWLKMRLLSRLPPFCVLSPPGPQDGGAHASAAA